MPVKEKNLVDYKTMKLKIDKDCCILQEDKKYKIHFCLKDNQSAAISIIQIFC